MISFLKKLEFSVTYLVKHDRTSVYAVSAPAPKKQKIKTSFR